jgi:hypothetical protein
MSMGQQDIEPQLSNTTEPPRFCQLNRSEVCVAMSKQIILAHGRYLPWLGQPALSKLPRCKLLKLVCGQPQGMLLVQSSSVDGVG